MKVGAQRYGGSNGGLGHVRSRLSGTPRSVNYLSVDNGMFSINYDLARRRDHEGRHHGGRLLPKERRGAIRA